METRIVRPEIISRKEALARGLKRYFTGKPCKHGHIADRLVSSSDCKRCMNIKCKRYKLSFDGKAATRRRYRKNRVRILAEKAKPSLEKICVMCGKDFIVSGKSRKRKTCGDECADTYHKEWHNNYNRIYKQKNPDIFKKYRRLMEVEKECVICGKFFLVKRNQVKTVCSKECMRVKNNKKNREWRRNNPDRAKARDKIYTKKYRDWRYNYRRSDKSKEADRRYGICGPIKPTGEVQWLRKSLALLRTARRIAKKRALGQPLSSNEESAIAEMSST